MIFNTFISYRQKIKKTTSCKFHFYSTKVVFDGRVQAIILPQKPTLQTTASPRNSTSIRNVDPLRTRLWWITISLRCGGRRTNSHYHLVTGRGICRCRLLPPSLPWVCFFWGGAGWDKKIYGIFKDSLSPDDFYLKMFLPRKRRFDWKGKLHEVPLPKPYFQ